MLLQLVRLAVRDGDEAAFEAALVEVRRRVFASAGFRGWEVAQDAERPAGYLVTTRWESADELVAFAEDRFRRAWEPVDPFLSGPALVDHYLERPGLGSPGAGTPQDLDLSWLA